MDKQSLQKRKAIIKQTLGGQLLTTLLIMASRQNLLLPVGEQSV